MYSSTGMGSFLYRIWFTILKKEYDSENRFSVQVLNFPLIASKVAERWERGFYMLVFYYESSGLFHWYELFAESDSKTRIG